MYISIHEMITQIIYLKLKYDIKIIKIVICYKNNLINYRKIKRVRNITLNQKPNRSCNNDIYHVFISHIIVTMDDTCK